MKARLRGTVVDVLDTAEGTAVLVDDHVLVLSPVAALILELLHEGSWSAASSMATALVSAFGEPPGDLDGTIEEALLQMRDNGVLEVKNDDASAHEVDKA